MKVPKQKVKVKIKTETSIIVGNVHIMVDGRLSDYISSQVNKFIPVTEAKVYPLEEKVREDIGTGKGEKVVFVNVEKIEMIEYL